MPRGSALYRRDIRRTAAYERVNRFPRAPCNGPARVLVFAGKYYPRRVAVGQSVESAPHVVRRGIKYLCIAAAFSPVPPERETHALAVYETALLQPTPRVAQMAVGVT